MRTVFVCCFSVFFLSCSSEVSPWGPVYQSSTKLDAPIDIEGFSKVEQSRIREAFLVCQDAFGNSPNNSASELVDRALKLPIRPLTPEYIAERTDGGVLAARGSFDFDSGQLLLDCGQHSNAFDLALTILHESGHYAREENPKNAGHRNMEYALARTAFEAKAHREEREHSLHLYRWVEEKCDEMEGKESWLLLLKSNIYSSRAAQLCYLFANDFVYIAKAADKRCKLIEASTPQYADLEPWRAGEAVRQDAWRVSRDVGMPTIGENYKGALLLCNQLKLMNELFGDLGPNDLGLRIREIEKRTQELQRLIEFSIENKIDGPTAVASISLDEILGL